MEGPLTAEDHRFLERARELAPGGWGRVHPNPMVGCVLARDGRVVGEGWHQELGGPHAEVNALRQAGELARGATAYVSLEPCDHHGRTPPCSLALREAGVRRVVYGACDPGKLSGGGGEALRGCGVEVVGPVLTRAEARRENPAFFHNAEAGSVYLALKLAQSLDGRIAAAPGERTSITGPEAIRETHRLRAGFDAVLVGSGTALVDDPLLTVREPVPMRTPPVRVILDSRCRLSPGARLLLDAPRVPLVVFTGEEATREGARALERAGARVSRVPGGPGGLDLRVVLEECWEMGMRSLLCEGGARLAGALLRGGWARRLYLFVAPFVLGEGGVPAFPDTADPRLWEGWEPASPPSGFGRDSLLTLDRAD